MLQNFANAVPPGSSGQLFYNNGGVFAALATTNNGVLVTNGSGGPSVSTTLPSGLAIPSPTVTGNTQFTGVGGQFSYQISPDNGSGTCALGAGSVCGQLYGTVNATLGATGVANRWDLYFTTLNTTTTSIIWEGGHNSFLETASGTFNGEINLGHSFYQNQAGVTAAQVEGYETSALNNGTMGVAGNGFFNYLGIFHNGSTGTVAGFVHAFNGGLTNDNTTAASVNEYSLIFMAPMAGAGSTPTSYYLIQGKEPLASISTQGGLAVGSLSNPGAGQALIQGPDQLSTTFVLTIRDSANGLLFDLADNGAANFPKSALTLGTPNSIAGKLSFSSATGGGATSLETTAGTQNAKIVFIPNVTANDTMAVLGTAQTFTALQTFSAGDIAQPLTTWADNQTCSAGQITWDANFIYVCTTTNTVKRASLATF